MNDKVIEKNEHTTEEIETLCLVVQHPDVIGLTAHIAPATEHAPATDSGAQA